MDKEEKELSAIEKHRIKEEEFGKLPNYYERLKKGFRKYMDMREEAYTILPLWIIGTYFHEHFETFPHLYFNAMKGSGKSRALKMISDFSSNGEYIVSITEAVLFRWAEQKKTLCIDEFESIEKEGQEGIRDLIKVGYKKGAQVPRVYPGKKGEEDEIRRWGVFCPVAIGNIQGMEEVIGDRCITIILEKSFKNEIINLSEIWGKDLDLENLRGGLMRASEYLLSGLKEIKVGLFDNYLVEWNKYTQGEDFDKEKFGKVFEKVKEAGAKGRYLELWSPLFIIADMIGEKVLEEITEYAKGLIKEAREKDREENRHIKIYEYVEQLEQRGFISMSEFVNGFTEFHGITEYEKRFYNPHWAGKNLRTLKLVKEHRKVNGKSQVILDIERAKEMYKHFVEIEESPKEDLTKELQEALK